MSSFKQGDLITGGRLLFKDEPRNDKIFVFYRYNFYNRNMIWVHSIGVKPFEEFTLQDIEDYPVRLHINQTFTDEEYEQIFV